MGTPYIVKLRRLWESPVAWSWAFQFIRLAAALILLPLVLRPSLLSTKDLGMYWAFAHLASLAALFDFGFSTSIGRNVAYAMAGAKKLSAEGHCEDAPSGIPNRPLLWQLLRSTRHLFLGLAAAASVVLAAFGSATVASRAAETSDPTRTWIAWGLVVVSAVLEIYTGWWNTYLRSMNDVLASARIAVLAFGFRLCLAAVFLLTGAGLLALPLAGLVSSVIGRHLSRKRCLALLGPEPQGIPTVSLIPILWPNSWRTGLQFFSVYLATNANTLLCLSFLGLEANARFGLTVQVTGLIASMSLVWTAVKWPYVGQLCKARDTQGLRDLLWPRLWLQSLTFLGLAALALIVGPLALRWIGSDKQFLPPLLFGGMLAYSLLETQFAFWTTLLSLMRNRIPSLWPTVVTNCVTVSVVVGLLSQLEAVPSDPALTHSTLVRGLTILAFAPLTVASLFSFWYWPMIGAREIQTRWWRFMFLRR